MIKAKLIGVLADKFPAETKANFTKRVFWVKEPDVERYPQTWEVELHNDDCRRLDAFQVGDPVEVEVEIRGRKYNSGGSARIYNSLKAVGMERAGTVKKPLFKN